MQPLIAKNKNQQKMWCTSTVVYQYLAAFSMNLLSISYGMAASWSSSSVPTLKSFETPINNGIPMTDSQISWITSLLGLGGLVGTVLIGPLADIFGRKKTLLALAIPHFVSWILIIAATDATLICVSRFLAGFGSGGMFVVIPVYTAEIAEDRIRGKLGSLLVLSVNFGILLGFITGHYLSFFTVPKCAMWFPVICFFTLIFFPESPVHLLRKSKVNDAVNALEIYRNLRRLSKQKLDFYKIELDKLTNTKVDSCSGRTITWKDFQCKSTWKAFSIGIMLVLLHSFCGVFVMMNYTASIFAQAGSQLHPNVAAIFVGLIQFIATYCSTFLVDRLGRKPLLITSALSTGLSLFTFGMFSYLASLGYETSEYGWIPIVTFSSMLFAASCGIIPLLTVIISELMPDKLRTFGATTCICVSWVLAFTTVYCFPSIVLAIGLHGCLFLFAGSCLVGAAFVLFYMPETKGKSFNEIRQTLEK